MTEGRCQAQTKTGKPCSATPRPGTSFCVWHAPDFNNKRSSWAREGGLGSSKANRAKKRMAGGLRDLETVQAIMLQALIDTRDGKLEPAILTALATAARSIDAIAKTTAAASMEERLDEMASQIVELSSRRAAS